MKKQLHSFGFIIIIISCFSFQSSAQRITIIESLSGNSWAVQDTIWREVAISMGYTATINTQTALDNLSNFDSTDVLIVASGTIVLPPIRMQTVIDFVKSGRPAYIQSEYLGTYGGDITFNALMDSLGVNFQWSGTISGQLVPMNILGTFATIPNVIDSLGYFNYGYAGSGTGVQPFLTYQDNYFGFYYADSTGCFGSVITVSDEDWVWNGASLPLMGNMLYRLVQDIHGVSAQPTDTIIAQGGNASFTVTTNLFDPSYQWQENSGSGWNNVTNQGIYSGAQTNILVLTDAPSTYYGYQYRCMISSECGNVTSDAATLTFFEGINDPAVSSVTIFPNPFSNQLEINFAKAGNYSVSLLNAVGQTVDSKMMMASSGTKALFDAYLSPGIYYLKISDGTNSVMRSIVCVGGR